MGGSFSLDRGRSALGTRRRGWAGIWLAMTLLGGAAAGPSRADMFTPGVKEQIKLGNQAAQHAHRARPPAHRRDEPERLPARGSASLSGVTRRKWSGVNS